MKEIKINEKTFSIPENWNEMTLRQYTSLAGLIISPIDAVGVVLQMSQEEVSNLQPQIVEDRILPHLDFIFTDEHSFDIKKVPNKIKVKDKTITVPRQLEFKTYGQKIHLTNAILDTFKGQTDPVLASQDSNFFKKFLELIPEALATYLYPEYHEEPFNVDKLEPFKELLLDYSLAKDAYPIAYFFLMRSIDSMKYRANTLMENTRKKKSKRGSKNSKFSGIFG